MGAGGEGEGTGRACVRRVTRGVLSTGEEVGW